MSTVFVLYGVQYEPYSDMVGIFSTKEKAVEYRDTLIARCAEGLLDEDGCEVRYKPESFVIQETPIDEEMK